MNIELASKALEEYSALRSVGHANFVTQYPSTETYKAVVEYVQATTEKWGQKVGINNKKKKVSDSSLSEREREWKEYFSSHSFKSPEDLRNLADAITILSGVDVAKFVNYTVSSGGVLFPSNICIVPLSNPNSHSYEIGSPILSSGTSPIFFSANGQSGNSMSTDLECLRLASVEEIESFLINLMYKNRQIGERLIMAAVR